MKRVKDEWSHLKQHPLAKNAVWLLLGQGSSMLCQALYFMLIARLLSTSEYGIYVGALALVSIASQYSPIGSHSVLLRYVSTDSTQFREYWGNVVATTFSFGTLLIIFFVYAGPHIATSYSATLLFYIACSECLFVQLVLAVARVFQAFERMRFTAILNLATSALRAILAGALLFHLKSGDALLWAKTTFVISAFACIVALILVTRLYGTPSFSRRLMQNRLGEGFVFALSYSTTGVYNDIDKAMLGHYGMNAANGIYTLAYRIVDSGSMPVTAVQGAAFPRMFRDGVNGLRETARFSRKIVLRTAPISLACAAVLFMLAPLAPLFLGKGFNGTGSTLRWLCILPFFRSFQLSGGDTLTGAGYQSIRLCAQATAAASNFLLNLYLIPRYSWRGAALASLITDASLGILNWGIVYVLLRKERRVLSIRSDQLSSTL